MRPKRGWILVLLGALLIGVTAADPRTPADIPQLIKQLGGDKFAEREGATKALDAIGEPALDALRVAAESSDPEVRRRAQDLVKLIEKRAETAAVLRPTRLRLSYKDMPAGEIVADLAKRTGYGILLRPQATAAAQRRVTIETPELTFWEAMDRFCEAAELTLQVDPMKALPGIALPVPPQLPPLLPGQGAQAPNIRRPAQLMDLTAQEPANTLVLLDGKPPSYPTAYMGALRVRAIPKPQETPKPGKGEALVMLELAAEPKLQGQDLPRVQVREAMDEKNQTLSQISPEDIQANARVQPGQIIVGNNNQVIVRQLMLRGGTIDLSGGNTWSGGLQRLPVRLKLPEEPGKKLVSLKGTVSAPVRTAPQPVVTLDDVSQATGKTTKSANNIELKVLDFQQRDGGEVQIRVEVVQPAAVGNALAAVQMQMQVQMQVMVNGQRMMRSLGVGPDTPFRLYDSEGRLYQLGASPEMQESTSNNVTTRRQVLVFKPPQSGAVPKKFEYTTTRVTTVDVPFALEDVALITSE